MSLIYTEGYLNSSELKTSAKQLEPNIKNFIIVPPINNNQDIVVSIYRYSPLDAVYEIHLLQEEIFVKGDLLEKNVDYWYKVSTSTVQFYYEKEDK